MDGATIYRVAFGEGRPPDAWQLALATDAWPRVLVAPTGSGKTAAVTLGWAAHRLRNPNGTPRRLVWCLPMRTLVEQTADAVKQWFGRLAAEVDGANRLPRPEEVHVLMGGVDADGWLETPERPAVLVGTQDMLLSRALMRGYASSRAICPMEFALLHEDAQWVFDEVQLMGAGRATSAQLEAFRRSDADRAQQESRPAGSPSRSLWISATLDPRWLATVDHAAPEPQEVVRVDPRTEADGRLARLARATKRLSRSATAPASSKGADITTYVGRLADAILAAHRTGRMTLAIVNRVARAQALHEAIKKRLSKRMPAAPALALVHSRFRPADRRREMRKVVAASDGNQQNRIVIATQAVEAGVDISAAVLFTEIAPWSSMVQRFGRANRYAELDDGADVHWIDLLQAADDGAATDKDAAELASPYPVAELLTTRERLFPLQDVAPPNLPPPGDVEPPRRVIRRKDLDDLFDTDPDLTGFDVDVSPYVRDADDTDVRVFWRDLSEPEDDPPRPRREELCAVSIGSARTWLSKVRTHGKGAALVYQRDPQWRRRNGRTGTTPAGLREERPRESLRRYGQGVRQRAALTQRKLRTELDKSFRTRGRHAHTLPPRLLDALSLDTADYQDRGWSRPPAARKVVYTRTPDAAPGVVPRRFTRRRTSRERRDMPTIARFLLAGRPRPRIEDAVRIGELLRRAALAQFGWRQDEATERRIPNAPWEISGRGADGRPLKDPSHAHAFWLPEDADEDGRIDHVSVFIAGGMNDDVRARLDRITRLWISPKQRSEDVEVEPGSVKEWRLALEGFGRPADFAGGARIFATSSRWRSVTPFLASGHLKAAGYPGEVRRLLQRRGLDAAGVEVTQLPTIDVGGTERRAIHFHRFRSRAREAQPDAAGALLQIVLRNPIEGPLAVGYGSHFGLGLFVAASEDDVQ